MEGARPMANRAQRNIEPTKAEKVEGMFWRIKASTFYRNLVHKIVGQHRRNMRKRRKGKMAMLNQYFVGQEANGKWHSPDSMFPSFFFEWFMFFLWEND